LTQRLTAEIDNYFSEVTRPESIYSKAAYFSFQMTSMRASDLEILRDQLARDYFTLSPDSCCISPPSFFSPDIIKMFLAELQSKLPASYPTVQDDRALESPIDWWREIGSKHFPYLQGIARVFLAVPATSAPSESVFSRAGFDDREIRSRLGAETLQCSLCVVRNIHLFADEHELISSVTRKIVSRASLRSQNSQYLRKRPVLSTNNSSTSGSIHLDPIPVPSDEESLSADDDEWFDQSVH
jgi:hypothetical protein